MLGQKIVVESQRKARIGMAQQPIEVFISYARKDKLLREKLEVHLSPLKRQGMMSSAWHDRQIVAGSEWEEEIDCHMRTADIILLLISPDFVHSKYCYEIELPIVMSRHEAKEACVVPILLRPVAGWENLPFAKLQIYPSGAKPVTRWSDKDDAFVDVVKGIGEAAIQIFALRQERERLAAEKLKRELEEQKRREEQERVRAEKAKQEQEEQAKHEQRVRQEKQQQQEEWARQEEQARQKRRAEIEDELTATLESLKFSSLRFAHELELFFERKPLFRIATAVVGVFLILAALNSLSPKTAESFFNEGLKKQDQKQSRAAIDDFDQAITLKPGFADAYYSRGVARYASGDITGAIADLDQAIKFKVEFAFAYHFRGNLRASSGDKPGAIADLKQAIELYQQQGNNDKRLQETLKQLKELQP
jgi:tetratricopeptide (TPR) repeat protein